MGLEPTKPAGLLHTEKWLLKDLQEDSLALRHSREATTQKAPRFYVKEAHLIILKHKIEGQGPNTYSTATEASRHCFGVIPLFC